MQLDLDDRAQAEMERLLRAVPSSAGDREPLKTARRVESPARRVESPAQPVEPPPPVREAAAEKVEALTACNGVFGAWRCLCPRCKAADAARGALLAL